jgi:cell division septation protein DedD
MTSILNLQTDPPAEADGPQREAEPSGSSDYEIVMGRTQIASWLFVGVIAITVCGSLAYLGGEAVATKRTPQSAVVVPAAPPVVAAVPAPLPQASLLAPSETESAKKSALPLVAEPETGKVYLQVGAVERGMAVILAEGMRTHGFDSFVAPGPNEKIFRVLIGPLPDPEAFRKAMLQVDALDLATFARKYQK